MKNKIEIKDFTLAIEKLLGDKKIKSVIVFCDPLNKVKSRIKVTKTKDNDSEFRVTFGKLNYQERKYIGLCKKQKVNAEKLLVSFEKVKK